MAIRVPSITTNACPAFFAARSAGASRGERAAISRTVSVTYRQAVAVPTPNPAASWARVSPLRRCARTSRACRPGFSLRQHDPIAARCRRNEVLTSSDGKVSVGSGGTQTVVYKAGDVVTITAAIFPNGADGVASGFAGWTGCDSVSSDGMTCTVTMNKVRSVTAEVVYG